LQRRTTIVNSSAFYTPAHPPGSPAAAWAERAEELARWTWSRLVNRVDVWGGYRPLHERGKKYTKRDGTTGTLGPTTTRPTPGQRGQILFTIDVVTRHYRVGAPEDVIGLHTTGTENSSRWGAVEVDWHGPTSSDPAANLAAALAWHDRFRQLGFAPLLTDSNGRGGYHLRTLFTEPAPTSLVFAFLHWLTADHAEHGLPHRPETFPKQPTIKPGGYGNWLRLPGRHHTREHWSKVWDGSRWLDGAEAVAFILALHPSSPSLIPATVTAPPPRPAPPPKPSISAPIATGGCSLERRIRGRLARLPHRGEGQGRDDIAYCFACWLVRDLALADAPALEWLRRWDAGNNPPKGEQQLLKVIASAHAYGRSEYGSGLAEPAPRQPFRVPSWQPRSKSVPVRFQSVMEGE
jgi:hypothetical protein